MLISVVLTKTRVYTKTWNASNKTEFYLATEIVETNTRKTTRLDGEWQLRAAAEQVIEKYQLQSQLPVVVAPPEEW